MTDSDFSDLPSRVQRALFAVQIRRIQDLLQWSERDLLRTPGIAKESVNGIVNFLSERGLALAGGEVQPMRSVGAFVSVKLPRDLIAEVDRYRGNETRATWIERVIGEAMRLAKAE